MSITSEPITYRDIVLSLRQLEISPDAAVLVHADIDRFGAVRGGADTFNGVLLSTFSKVLMPAFTHQTVVVPGIGPQNNAIQYGSGVKANLQASFFHKDQPVDEKSWRIAGGFTTSPAGTTFGSSDTFVHRGKCRQVSGHSNDRRTTGTHRQAGRRERMGVAAGHRSHAECQHPLGGTHCREEAVCEMGVDATGGGGVPWDAGLFARFW